MYKGLQLILYNYLTTLSQHLLILQASRSLANKLYLQLIVKKEKNKKENAFNLFYEQIANIL
jgi:hypothetical protein